VLFLAATIQTAGDVLQLSSNEPAKLMESTLGYAGKVEDITIKPLAPTGCWQVTGFLRLHNFYDDSPTSIASRKPTPAGGAFRCDLQSRARALYNRAVNDREVANTTDAEEGGYRRLYDGGCGDGGSDQDDDDDNEDDDDNNDDDYDELGYEASGTGCATGRTNRRWDPLEEQRLLAWKKEEKSWEWICNRFPDRSEGAVRLRWQILRRSAQRAD